MVEAHWGNLEGKELRYNDNTWELTGDVAVLDRGDRLAVEARQVDDVRHQTARLHFGVESPPASLNPGALGDHFDRLEKAGDDQYLVVKKEGRTYRYELRRMEYK
ncbi:hypothetical protein ACFQH6_11785 [Halobacteriaceae archaeon GCM10025711]